MKDGSHKNDQKLDIAVAIVVLSVAFGCRGGTQTPLTEPCRNNASLQFERITQRHQSYQSKGLQSGDVYWSRYYLETGRHVMYGQGGIDGSGAACTPGDRESEAFAGLEDRLRDSEPKVVDIESARGVRFDRIDKGRPVWVRKDSGQEVPNNEANTL